MEALIMGLFNILGDWVGNLPSGSKLSRRAWIVIQYTPKGETESKDISEDISKYFLHLSYADNISNTADDITLTLEDRALLWSEDWFPEEGSMLDITIHRYNWKNLSEGEIELPLGKFEIDEIEVTGFPSTVQIKAVSVLGNSTLRGVRKNRTWEKISVWKCADDICKENGIELFWDCAENPNLDHVEQADESDLAFLQKICKDNGRSLKVTPEKIIIFDDDKYEQNDPVIFCLKPGAQDKNEKGLAQLDLLTGYTLKAKTRDIYWKCKVKYQRGKDKKVIEGEFAAPDKTEGRILYVGDQVADTAEAERLAKKKLRDANKEEFKGTIATLGDFNLVAGLVIQMAGFGKFDGNYVILKASHEIGESYTTSIEVRKCLNGY